MLIHIAKADHFRMVRIADRFRNDIKSQITFEINLNRESPFLSILIADHFFVDINRGSLSDGTPESIIPKV